MATATLSVKPATHPHAPASEAPAPVPVNLCAMAPATPARVLRLETPPEDATRLKSLGLCVGRRVEVVKSGDPLIVRVLGARVGLSARLAATVYVERCDD